MALEIERKFLVSNPSYRDMATTSRRLVQGYLCRDVDATVRIRIIDDAEARLTVKGRNDGAVRSEFEYAVPVADARAMLKMCTGTVIDKRRYLLDFGGRLWEVDEFAAPAGVPTIAEVELEDAAAPLTLPPFVGEEVTGNPRYYNSQL